MDLKVKYRMYVVAAFLFAAAITFAAMMPFCRQAPAQETLSNVNALSDSTWFIQENFLRAQLTEGTRLPDLMVNADSGQVSLLASVDRPTLVFRYFDTNCTDCIQKEAELVKQHARNIADRVVFLGSFRNYHSLKAFNQANHISQKSLQTDLDQQLAWEPDTHHAPYYFILYPGGKTSHFFMSMAEFTAYTRSYLEGIDRLLAE